MITKSARRARRELGQDVNQREDSAAVEHASELVGYRLVRVLESTAVSTSWLATPSSDLSATHVSAIGPSATNPSATDQSGSDTAARTVELTRYIGPPSSALIPEATLAVSSPHVHGALDLATDDAGQVVLIAERTDRTLAALLAERHSIPLGEAVTILAPTASGLAALHRSGFVHGALTSAAVALTPDGRPVLTRLTDTSSPLPSGQEGDVLRRGDLRALRALLDEVFGRCAPTDDVQTVLRWVDRTIGTPDDGESFFSQLDLRLFALAEPLPVDLDPAPFVTSAAMDARDVAVSRITGSPGRHQARVADEPGWLARVLTGTGIDTVAELVDSSALGREIKARTAGVAGWARRAVRGRATVFLVTTFVAIFGVWGGLTLVPDSGTAASGSLATPGATPARVEATEAELAAVGADDPAAALSALLAVRARCLASTRGDCLHLVDEPGSAAEATDLHAIRTNGSAPLAGQRGVLTAPAVELLQHTGHAVLFRVQQPAETANQPVLVLVMKTGTGWRLRDLADPD